MSENCDVIAIFSIYDQFGAIWKRVKLTFSLLVTFFLTKIENGTKISNTALTLSLWVKVLFWPKSIYFLPRNVDFCKNKRALVLKGIFSETAYVCTYVPNFKFLANL